MLKKIAILGSSLLFTFQVMAADCNQREHLHSPAFKTEMLTRLQQHVKDHRMNPITSGANNAISAASSSLIQLPSLL